MLVTDKLLFLHLHKSAGTFINAMLLRCVPSASQIGYHLPYREVPSAYRTRPVLGTVRSPWAYYVSWYHFQNSQAEPNVLFRICSDGGKLGFAGTVRNLVDLAADEGRLALLEQALPETYTNYGLNLTKRCVGELRERRVGFYSFLFERLYAGAHEPIIVPVEQLREGLRSTLTLLGHLPNQCIDRFLNEVPSLNASQHDEPSRYFDDPLAAMVAERDSKLIVRYEYVL